MNTLILNGTAKDLKLLLDISKKIGIDLKVVKEKNALAKPEVLDEDGLTAEDREFITDLSKKTKKAAAKRFYNKLSKKNSVL